MTTATPKTYRITIDLTTTDHESEVAFWVSDCLNHNIDEDRESYTLDITQTHSYSYPEEN